MRFIEIATGSTLRTFVLVFQTGDEVASLLKTFAVDQGISAARFTAVGGFSEAILGYFVLEERAYEPIPIGEQVEVLSVLGDIALDGDEPIVHAHVTVGHRGGRVSGGHLLRAIVRPTLEVMLDELPAHLQKSIDPAAHIPLIDPSLSRSDIWSEARNRAKMRETRVRTMDNDLQPQPELAQAEAATPEPTAVEAAPAPVEPAAPVAAEAAEAPAPVEAPVPVEASAPVEPPEPEAPEIVIATPEAVVAAPVPVPAPPVAPDPEAIERAKVAAAARSAADATRRAQAEEAWKALAVGKTTREIVEAIVKSAVKGGYLVSIGAFRGFLPASQSRLAGIAPEELAGTKIPTIVLDADDAKKRVVVSHRQALEVQRRGARAELLANLKVGAEREATVVRLADFGAFVDLGGVDALVPIGELALERVEKVADVVKIGDKFAVKVLRVDEGGKKIGVSRRAMLPDPWRDHAALLQRGKVVEGKVIENGAELKIELAPGIVGTISENEAIPSDYELGEAVEVSIRSLDPRTRRLRLSTMHATPSFESGSFAPLGHELKN